MNHYPHHIGDFDSATRHLTRVERSLYRDLLDQYYSAERPLIADFDKLARRVIAVTDEERQALVIVLDEFFVLEDDGWHNSRCDAEIAKYQGQIEQASRAGKASAAKRTNAKQSNDAKLKNATATTVERPLNDRATNQNQNQNQSSSAVQVGESALTRGDDDRIESQEGWAKEFSSRYGVLVDVGSERDRKKFWPLATQWIAAGVTVGQMRAAVDRARADTTEPIAYLPSYVDRVLATMQAPVKAAPSNLADIARVTVPGTKERDPALIKFEADAVRAAPIPKETRELQSRLRRERDMRGVGAGRDQAGASAATPQVRSVG